MDKRCEKKRKEKKRKLNVGRLDKDTTQTLSKYLIQVGENTQRVKKILSAKSSRKLKQTLEVKRFKIDIGGSMGKSPEGPPTVESTEEARVGPFVVRMSRMLK